MKVFVCIISVFEHMMRVINDLKDNGLMAGVVTAEGVSVKDSPVALTRKLEELVRERAMQEFPPKFQKDCIRNLLRRGGFKPTGRNKPASEYLVSATSEARFPRINNLVDINNYISLLSGLPASILDLNVTGRQIELRTGKPGETYVFNASGQVIDLKGLLCVCRRKGAPLGNPVKDSMEGKVIESTSGVILVIYSSTECVSRENLEGFCELAASMLEKYAQAGSTETIIA